MVIGIPVSGALVAGSIGYLVGAYATGDVPNGSDWFGIAMFGGFSCVIAWIALRARARVMRGGAAPGEALVLLARASPALLVLGALLGAYASHAMTQSHARSLRESARYNCGRLLPPSEATDESALDRCTPIALSCELARRRAESTRGAHMRFDFEQSPEAACIRAGLARP